MTQLPRSLLLAASLFAACGPEFDPYNELSGLRVLALRAEPAELAPGMSTTIEAIIYQRTETARTYRWSVCPWPSNPNDGFPCLVDQAMWQSAWESVGLSGTAPSLDLGSADTATLTYPASPEELEALCEAMAEAVGTSSVVPPDCSRRWPWTVRLSLGADAEGVDSVKNVNLLIAPGLTPNQNPALRAFEVAGHDLSQGEPELASDREHKLSVRLAPNAAETYEPDPIPGQSEQEPTKEQLLFTWFIDRGETEHIRTTFKEGVEPLDKALVNTWQAPSSTGRATLYVLVRDSRGGVGFLTGKVRLTK